MQMRVHNLSFARREYRHTLARSRSRIGRTRTWKKEYNAARAERAASHSPTTETASENRADESESRRVESGRFERHHVYTPGIYSVRRQRMQIPIR